MNEKSRQESAEHSPDDIHPRPIFFPLQEFATDPADRCTDDNAPKVSHEFILVVCVFLAHSYRIRAIASRASFCFGLTRSEPL